MWKKSAQKPGTGAKNCEKCKKKNFKVCIGCSSVHTHTEGAKIETMDDLRRVRIFKKHKILGVFKKRSHALLKIK
jgi:hypothetical protein